MNIFEVVSSVDMTKVWELTYSVYLGMGYCNKNDLGLLRHYPYLDCIPETKVFAIEENGIMEATASYSIDGLHGLPMDHIFFDELNSIRKECREKGWRLGAGWRIVTRPENRKIETLLKIINAIFKSGRNNLDVFLLALHPKHVKIYSRLLDLNVIAGPRDDIAVNSSPAMLMRGNVPQIVTRWQKVYDNNSGTTK
jgi:hypothetical protein